MDEDQILQSIIADPQLADPSIDVSQLRQTTPTRTELLANVPEFSGLRFDPTQRSYIEDLYSVYGGGLPMLPEPVVETPAVTTPIVDTSVMGQPADDSVLDTTPTTTIPTVTQLTGGGADMANVPATGQVGGITGDPITIENIGPGREYVQPDGTVINIDPLEEQMLLEELRNEELGTDTFTPTLQKETISEPPVIGDFSEPTIGTVDPTKAFTTTPLSDVELVEQGFLPPISQPTPPGFEPTVTIDETPETFIDKTKNFLGLDDVNLPEFAIKAAINTTVGKPITLAFDLAKNIFGGQTTQDQGVTPDAGFADVVDDQGITADDAFDTTNEAAVNAGTPSFEGFDSGGFDPLSAPPPYPPDDPPEEPPPPLSLPPPPP